MLARNGVCKIDPRGRQFRLKKGAKVALVADHQAVNTLGQIPERLAFITGGRASPSTR